LVSSSVFIGGGLASLALGLASFGSDSPHVARAAYRPFDNSYTDQEHHRNDVLLPRERPVEIVRTGLALQAGPTASLQILAVNDFHGNLEPPTGGGGRISTATGNVDAGGIEYLSTHIAELKKNNPNTIVVSAGDMIGASPVSFGALS
jgi:2',3'-cyclic-nucleotide 2'-phosphodiesterase (5'-nucleotidase family)